MSNMEKLCKECKHYDWPVSCYYHYQDRINPVTGDRSFIHDNASNMRNPKAWVYFWFWNNCGKGGRLWEKREDEDEV